MKIASWNINSLRLRVVHLAKIDADIICLQEMKCQNHEVPKAELEKLGFVHQYVRGEKAYNGVGIFSKIPLSDVEMLNFGGNEQARHISALLPSGVRLHNFYVPAGGDEPDVTINPSYAHKLRFVEDMVGYFNSLNCAPLPRRQIAHRVKICGLAELRSESSTQVNGAESEGKRKCALRHAPLELNHIILGDFNIAPFEHDVWSSKQLRNVISHTPPERERMEKLYATRGWVDVARHFVPMDEKCYSWWSYRNRDWKKSNRGRRLDHIWITPELKNSLRGYEAIRPARDWEKPSDHVPIVAQFSLLG